MSNDKHYPTHHTDHENFPDIGAVYVTKAEFDAMKSERDALQKLVEEKQKLLDEATDRIVQLDAANGKQYSTICERQAVRDNLRTVQGSSGAESENRGGRGMIEPGSVNEHLVRIKEELRKAEAKHPNFCDAFSGAPNINSVRLQLHHVRNINERYNIYAEMILLEEVYEAVEAYFEGDKAHCYQELAQCGAVVIRMMELVKNEMENEKQ